MLARRIHIPSSLRQYTSAASSSTSASQPLATQLITSAQAHIPTHGFTHQALKAGTPSHLANLDDWTINNLFPGGLVGETSVPVRLFRRWDTDQRQRAKSEAEAEAAASQGEPLNRDTDEAVRDLAAVMLESRLRLSDSVKMHLHEPFSQLSAVEIPTPVRSLLLSRLPPPLSLVLPSSIPNPLPLLSRSFDLVDDFLNASQAQHRQQQQQQRGTSSTPQQVKQEANDTAPDTYIPIYGSEWYTTRTHLALAYLASELHLISPASQGVEHSVGILHSFLEHRLGMGTDAQDPSSSSSVSQLLRSGKEWIEWGGRGWAGILRSRGL